MHGVSEHRRGRRALPAPGRGRSLYLMDKLPWLGASVKRKEDDRLLRGSGRFVDDVEETLALHLAIGRCPYPHARIRRIDVRRALEQTGVEAVLIGEEVVARTEPITVLRP